MRKQFITAVILTALLVTGCGAAEGDTAVTAAGTEAAATNVAAETAGEETSAEEKSVEEVASDSTVKAEEEETEKDEAEAEDEESEETAEAEEETEAESEDEEAESEDEEAESEDEETESEDEETESEDEEDEEAESEEEDAESEDEEDEEAESEEEDAESEDEDADDVTVEEGAPRAYSGRTGRTTVKDKADEEESAEDESEAEAEEEGIKAMPGPSGGRPGAPGHAPSKDGRDKAIDEEYEAFWDEIFPDLEDGEGEYDNFWDVFPEVSDGEYDNFWEMFPDLDIDEGMESDEEQEYDHGRGSIDGRPEAPETGRERSRGEAPEKEKSGSRDKDLSGQAEKPGKEPAEKPGKEADEKSVKEKDEKSGKENKADKKDTLPEFEESAGLAFKSNKDGTCVITGIGTCDDTVIVIPQKSPKGDVVAAIGEGAFDHARGIEGVVFKDLLIEIESGAFTGSSIESVVSYGSSLVINEDAFSYTEDLSYFAADESEIVADPYAFDSAFDGADLVFTDSTLVFDDASFVYSGVRSMIGRDSTFIIGEDAFDYCEDIETMEFTDCYVDIGAYAFFSSGDETEILFELSDVTIGEDAFAFSDIINLEINGSTVQIGEDAFDYCDAIEDIIVRASVVETDPYAFYGCGNQAKVVFQNGEVSLGKDAFAFADIASLKMVRCDVTIGPEAFKSCSSLRRLDIGSGNINIGKRAFYNCADLREIMLGENGQGPHSIVIGENAFEFCGLDKVMIGKGSVEIGSGAFKYCENLRDVKVRGAIEKIGRNAFFRCDDELIIHYGGEDYDARTIQDVVSSLDDDTPQPSLRKDARSRTILRASFDGSSFGDTYQVGEVWNVPGQWKITIDSVYETGERSEASEHEPAAVYVIDYTYENTGYKGVNGASEGLYLSLSSAGIEDAEGASGYIYPGSIAAAPIRISKGESCKAQGRVGVDNPGNFTITFKMTDGNHESQQASFVIDISNLAQPPAAPPAEADAEAAGSEEAANEEIVTEDAAAEDIQEEASESEAA